MIDEQKYTIQGLDEYIRQGEPQQRERSEAWNVAIDLQQVDRLQTSEYLLDTAKRHIEGDISFGKVTDEATPQSGNKTVKSAKLGDKLPPKCKNCTLEEVELILSVPSPKATHEIAPANAPVKLNKTQMRIFPILQGRSMYQVVLSRTCI